MSSKPMTVNDFYAYKSEARKIAVTTCYDYTSARLLSRSDMDCVLVGDSLGMVFSGFDSTLPVTLEQMCYHTESVRRGLGGEFLIADMPFLSYQPSVERAVESAGRLLQSGANSVKIEGGAYFLPVIEALHASSIPVCGHLGMTPQSINQFGGFKVQGRSGNAAKKIVTDAVALANAGVFAIVLELIPEELAEVISREIRVPTIGIGAGRYCDGQVLVINDILGLDEDFSPRMVKKYMNGAQDIVSALNSYSKDVREGSFPGIQHVFSNIN